MSGREKSYWEKATHQECVAEVLSLQRQVISDWQYREVMKRQEDEIDRLTKLCETRTAGLADMQRHRDQWRSFALGQRDEAPSTYLDRDYDSAPTDPHHGGKIWNG